MGWHSSVYRIDTDIRNPSKICYFFVVRSRKAVPGISDEAYGAFTTDSNVPDAKETGRDVRKGVSSVSFNCIAQKAHGRSWSFRQRVMPWRRSLADNASSDLPRLLQDEFYYLWHEN
jgi:hypothetical protein